MARAPEVLALVAALGVAPAARAAGPDRADAPPPTATARPAPTAPTAPPAADEVPERRKVTHLYRKGLLVTLATGAALGQGSGYPNDVQKIDQPQHFARSPTMLGTSFQVFLGGALTDYLSFGVLLGGTSLRSSDWEVRATTVGVRLDTFPGVLLFPRSKALANLGLGADLGAGMVKVQATGNYPLVDGFQSMLGASAFYEFRLVGLLGGHLSLAPELSYHAAYTTSAEAHYLALGTRLSFYGGP